MPTEADWGRLYKFNTSGDTGLIMPFRSYYFRDFLNSAWQDISLGFIHCEMGNGGGDQATLIDERLAEIAATNLFHFGLSQSIAGNINVAANPYFMGVRGILGGITEIITATSELANLAPTFVNGAATSVTPVAITMDLAQGISGTPFAMFGVRFVLNQSNNMVYMNYANETGVALADDAANQTTLETFLTGISGNTSGATASFPLANPQDFRTWFLYWPYEVNRIKLQCVGAIKNG